MPTTIDVVSLVKNPTFEVDTTTWATTGGTISRSTAEFHSGVASLKLDTTAVDNAAYIDPTTNGAAAIGNAVYSASVWVKGTGSARMVIATLPGGAVAGTSATVTLTGTWQRITITAAVAGTATTVYAIVYQRTAGAQTMYIDDLTLVQDISAFDFNGNSVPVPGATFRWSGTANNSFSIMRMDWSVTAPPYKTAIDTRFDSFGAPVQPSYYAPPVRVLQAIESGLVHVTRRAEIFEFDGVTPWRPANVAEEEYARLIDGSVSVDYGSDERRKIDLQLENIDNILRPNPYDGFWYDKVVKVFRGVEFDSRMVKSAGAIMESQNADRTKSQLGQLGLPNLDDRTDMVAQAYPAEYDYYIADMGTFGLGRAGVYKRLWLQGKKIITIGIGSVPEFGGGDGVPLYTGSNSATVSWGVAPVAWDTPTSGSFTLEQTTASAAGIRASLPTTGTIVLSEWPSPTPTMITAAMGFSATGGIWLDLRVPDLSSTQARNLLAAAIRYMERYGSENTWETQLGEFLIDRIDIDYFPNLVKVTGRDYTKKLMNTRLKFTSTFVAGTPLKLFLQSVAANGGIADGKMKLSVGTEALTTEMSFERGTDRWTMLKEACNSYNYEIFFDAYGNLVVRPFLDPTTSPISWSFNVGAEGNLVSYSRSTNDSRVFNHVTVFGDPTDSNSNAIPFFGEAEVTDVTSPVHWTKIGDRAMPPIVSNFLSSDAEAQALAVSRLQIAALESYELNFESIVYPWLEVGEIVDIADPLATQIEPTRFLMDTLEIPLGLTPMGATGKRVTFVGSSGG